MRVTSEANMQNRYLINGLNQLMNCCSDTTTNFGVTDLPGKKRQRFTSFVTTCSRDINVELRSVRHPRASDR